MVSNSGDGDGGNNYIKNNTQYLEFPSKTYWRKRDGGALLVWPALILLPYGE